MKPILFYIGSFPIYTYGFMLFLSFIAGIMVARTLLRKRGIAPDIAYDLVLICMISGIIGSRMFFVIQHYKDFHFGEIFTIWRGGLVFYGGFLLAVVCLSLYIKIKKLPVLQILDILAVCVAVGLCLTRIGCFCNGCCFGKNCPEDSWLGVHYPADSLVGERVNLRGISIPYLWRTYAPEHIHHWIERPGGKHKALAHLEDYMPKEIYKRIFQPVYATQIFSSINGLVLCFLLLLFSPYRLYDGEVSVVFGVYYGMTRFSIEMLRADTAPILGTWLTAGQFVSVILFFICGTLFLFFRLKKKIK